MRQSYVIKVMLVLFVSLFVSLLVSLNVFAYTLETKTKKFQLGDRVSVRYYPVYEDNFFVYSQEYIESERFKNQDRIIGTVVDYVNRIDEVPGWYAPGLQRVDYRYVVMFDELIVNILEGGRKFSNLESYGTLSYDSLTSIDGFTALINAACLGWLEASELVKVDGVDVNAGKHDYLIDYSVCDGESGEKAEICGDYYANDLIGINMNDFRYGVVPEGRASHILMQKEIWEYSVQYTAFPRREAVDIYYLLVRYDLNTGNPIFYCVDEFFNIFPIEAGIKPIAYSHEGMFDVIFTVPSEVFNPTNDINDVRFLDDFVLVMPANGGDWVTNWNEGNYYIGGQYFYDHLAPADNHRNIEQKKQSKRNNGLSSLKSMIKDGGMIIRKGGNVLHRFREGI